MVIDAGFWLAAYLAMGLFVSSRTDNAIVALLGSVLLGLLFYLPGSSLLAGLVSASLPPGERWANCSPRKTTGIEASCRWSAIVLRLFPLPRLHS